MKPFFEDPALTLYQGDALAVLQSLPPLCVDAVMTDPPYSSGGLMLSARQADPAVKYQNTGTVKTYPPMFGDNRDQRSFIMWATLWLAECWRVARDGSPLLMFSDWRQLPAMTDAVQAAGWTWRGVVVWHKRTGRPLRGEFRREAEFVIFASKGRLGYRGPKCLPGLYAHTVDHKKKNHLTSKPVELLRELMEVVPEGGTVLDPFIGGGSTAEAARDTGRTCIGVELSPDYAAITAQRVAS